MHSPETQFNPEAENPPEPIKETETSVAYLGVALEKATVKGGDFVPKREQYEDFINDKDIALPLQRDIAVAFLNGEPMLVDGGTSLGKTTTVRKMCSELGWEVHYANLNGATDVEDLMGRYIPNPHKKHADDPEYIFADGKVTSGLRQEKGKIKVVILDEFNASAPNILIRLHEVLDALERGGDVVLSEDASEAVAVNKQRTKVIALMNPPGKGYFGREPLDPAQLRRWVYKKLPSELPEATFSHSTDVLFGTELATQEMPKKEFLSARDNLLVPEQLQEISGMSEILAKYKEFHKAAKELLKNRKIAEDQPQPFTYDDRMEPRRVRDFVLRFYNGDINETFQRALQYYYVNKLESKADKDKLGELIRLVEYKPPVESKRKGLEPLGNNEVIINGEKIIYDPNKPFLGTPVGTRFNEKATGKKWVLAGTWTKRDLAGMTPQLAGVFKSGEEARMVGGDELSKGFEKMATREKGGEVAYEKAKEIMKEDFFGYDEVHKAWGMDVATGLPEGTPPIPWNEAELRAAKTQGEMLILRIGKDRTGKPFTMKRLNEIGQPRMTKDEGKLLFDTDWYKDEAFYKNAAFETKWVLAKKEFVPDSAGKDYIEQTRVLRDYLKGIDAIPDSELRECSDAVLDTIRKTMGSDSKKASQQLADLLINKNHRRSPAEILYDWMLRLKNRTECTLENTYDWSSARTSGGGLVSFGDAGAEGALVSGYSPDNSYDFLGVVSVR